MDIATFCVYSVEEEISRDCCKSLARPGRKQATATELGIYSTYSPGSSIHFLARCSIFCQPFKKKWECCPSNQVSAAVMSALDEKWRPSFSFQSRKQVVDRRCQNRRIGLGAQDIGSPGRPVSFVASARWAGAFSCMNKTALVILLRLFLQNILQLHQQRWRILRVNSLALSKIISQEDAVLIPKKNRGENFSNWFLHSQYFGARWAAIPPLHWLLLCLRVMVI